MIEATRAKGPFEMEPHQWLPVKTPSGPKATFTDTKGHEGLLTDHDIAADGTVTPSVVCTEEDCGFHDWVKLVGWAP